MTALRAYIGLKWMEEALAIIEDQFDSIISAEVYDGRARIQANGPKNLATINKAERREQPGTEFYKMSVQIGNVTVFWLEPKEGVNNEAV